MTQRNLWPIGITCFLVLFVAIVVTAGILISKERYDLVRKDYYAHEIAYEDHIEGLRRTQALDHKPTIQIYASDRSLGIQFPPSLSERAEPPQLHLYYPADKHQDIHLDLELDGQGQQRIPLPPTASGNWKAGLQWKLDGHLYILEQRIQL